MNLHNLDYDLYTVSPKTGDMVVIRFPQMLTREQRDHIARWIEPKVKELGCQAMVLEAGATLELWKKATDDQD
jgi:hypothetical protein